MSWETKCLNFAISPANGKAAPSNEQLSAKDNRKSDVIEQLQIIVAETVHAPKTATLTDAEREKFESERAKLYLQLDEKGDEIQNQAQQINDLRE